jgi:dTMP kinase
MALLFAADRLDHIEATIQPNLRDGVTILSDRYDYSSVAYQSLTSDGGGDAVPWVRDVNRFARRPDLTLVLDVDPAEAARRRRERSAAVELFEDLELQRQLARFYRDIDAHFPGDPIVHIDAGRSVDEVAADILRAVDPLFARG